MRVKFKRRFLDWKKGEIADLDAKTAKKYMSSRYNICTAVKSPGRPRTPSAKNVDAAPKNKQVKGAANK